MLGHTQCKLLIFIDIDVGIIDTNFINQKKHDKINKHAKFR